MPKQNSKIPLLLLRFLSTTICVVALLAIWVSVFGRNAQVQAATSSTINFQARLLTTAGSTVPDGDYNIEFKLYTTPTADGGETPIQGSCTTNPGAASDEDCLWTETRISSNKVRVVNGYLTVNLGSVTAFASTINWDQELWLGMNVGGAGSPSWDGEMTPRLKLTAVPYAFRAGQLVLQSGSLTSTLSFITPTITSKSISVPNENGTICLQGSTNCGFAPSSGSSSYINNTTTVQTNANIAIQSAADASVSLLLKERGSQTGDLLRIVDSANVRLFSIDTFGFLHADGRADFQGAVGIGNTSSSGQQLRIATASDSTIGLTIDGTAAQSGDLLQLNHGVTPVMVVGGTGNALFKTTTNSTNGFQIQNSSSARVLGVDTSGGGTLFGQSSSLNAKLVFYNASNSNAVTIQSGTTTTSYTLTLPTVLGASGNCIKDTTGTGVLGFGACGAGGGGGGSSLQDSYDNSGTINPQITLNASYGGIKVRDASGGVSGNLLQLQNATGTATYFGLAATGLTLQDTSGNNAFVLDSSTSHLRIYADTTSPTAYADIYYDSVAGEAVFTASTGTTRIGSGSGNITLQLTAAADVLQATKTVTLGAAYSNNDFTFTRNITAGSNSLTGSVVKIESTSTGSGTVASNLLWINENNNSATGNLILATKNGAGNEKFKVDVSGAVTTAAGITVASGQTISSGSGALGISAGSGNLTLTAGGANTVIAKPGTNSTASFQVQNASAGAIFTADTINNRLQVGSSNTDSTAVLHILDSYNQTSDPTGVTGAMYYNTTMNRFRCYESGAWKNCVGALAAVRTTNSSAIGATETQVLAYTIPANSSVAGDTYRITAYCTRAGASATAPTIRIRSGSTTLTGNIAATLTGFGSTTAQARMYTALVTIRTTGASGTVGGGLTEDINAQQTSLSSTSTVAVDTTSDKLIELTFTSGTATNSYIFTYATIEKMSN
jgi:hypothetical protein